MSKKHLKATRRLAVLLAFCCLFGLCFASIAQATDRKETVTYVLDDRPLADSVGTSTRVFLPKVVTTLSNGKQPQLSYRVSKNGEEVASGIWEAGAYIDVDGEGKYVVTYYSDLIANTYEVSFTAHAATPSIVTESAVPYSMIIKESFLPPAAKITYNSQTKDALIRLHLSDGSVYQSEGKPVMVPGVMKVEYYAEFDGRVQSVFYSVNVINTEFGFYDSQGDFYPLATKAYENQINPGVVLNGNQADVYTFSQKLNLSAATKDDVLISLNNAALTSPITTPTIYLIDANDSRNFIKIQCRRCYDSDMVVYCLAAAPNQKMVGLLDGAAYYDGYDFGTTGNFAWSPTGNRVVSLTFFYDAAEKALYVEYWGRKLKVADFDADYQLSTWKGFTTGEVYLAVERSAMDDFMCIENVAGVSMSDYSGDIAAPSIKLDIADENNLPYAVEGMGYPLFDVKVVDMIDLDVDVDVRVYQGYNVTSGIEMNIRNNAFVPKKAGDYTIVYSATDDSGNTAIKKLLIKAVKAEAADEIIAEIGTLPESAYVGTDIYLPEPQNVSGGSGEVKYSINITAPDNSAVSYEKFMFRPKQAGTYKVEYCFTDYVGIEKVYTYNIQCNISKLPILESVALPGYIMSGAELKLPAIQATDYATNDMTTSITATIDGVAVPVENGIIKPVTGKTSASLEVTYIAKNKNGSAEKKYTIQVLNANIGDRTTFFFVEEGSFGLKQKNEAINFTTAVSNSAVRFVNSVAADKLQLAFQVDPTKNDSDRLTVYLYDAFDSSISVRLDMVKPAAEDPRGKTEFYINGNAGSPMVGNFYGGVAMLGIRYNQNSRAFYDSEGYLLGLVNRTQAGEPFTGFPSGKVQIVIEAGKIGSKGFSFNLSKINNQNFSGNDMFFDNYAEILVQGSLNLNETLGNEILIPSAITSDVLSPVSTVTLKVRFNNATIVNNQDISKPVALKLDQYGTYYIDYSYSDGGSSRTLSYRIKTVENEPPTVEMPKLPSTAKVGKTIKLELPTVTDNYTKQVRVTIIFRTPTGRMDKVNSEEMTYVPDVAGKYTIVYYVYDECDNYRIVEHTLRVS